MCVPPVPGAMEADAEGLQSNAQLRYDRSPESDRWFSENHGIQVW